MTAVQLKALREIAEIIEQMEDMPHVAAALRESAQEIERLTEALRSEREAKSKRRTPPPAVNTPGY